MRGSLVAESSESVNTTPSGKTNRPRGAGHQFAKPEMLPSHLPERDSRLTVVATSAVSFAVFRPGFRSVTRAWPIFRADRAILYVRFPAMLTSASFPSARQLEAGVQTGGSPE